MPRSIEEIQADIAKVKNEMALRDRYSQGFNQPSTKVGWNSYIINNDRGLLDQYQNREAAWRNMMAAQEAQERLADKNAEQARIEQEAVRKRDESKAQLEADLAQAEYDDAVARVDMDRPETVTAAKKAALKLNYANSNLPYYDKEIHTVPTEFTADAPGIADTKAVNNAVTFLNTIKDVDRKRWTTQEAEEYEKQIGVLREKKPELVKQYEVAKANKGPTVDEQERNEFNRLQAIVDSGKNLTSKQRRRYNALKPKYGSKK